VIVEVILECVAAGFAIISGLYGAYAVFRRATASRPYTKPLRMFSGTNELRDNLLKLRGRTVDFDTALDFSVGDHVSSRIADETEYTNLLGNDASLLNGQRLPLYVLKDQKHLVSFASLVVDIKQERRLKFSHGGAGINQILLKGRFEVEVRAYSGPSVEITLREV
jgi:hypothetical protein